MNKKFKFKLDGFLKLKTFQENKLRLELGQIVKEIEGVKANIERMHAEIQQTYMEQDRVMQESASGQLLQFFPYFISSKKEDIKNQESLLFSLQKRYQRKIEELSDAMGETKMINNLKEKKFNEHKKKMEKKADLEREEQFISRRQFLKTLEGNS